MAGIEQYGQPVVRARPLDAPLVNPGIASPDAFGLAIAEGINRGAHGIAVANKLREREEATRDEVEAFDAYNRFIDEENDRAAEFLTRTGGRAVGLPEEARTAHDKSRDSLAQGLTRPGARERFNQLAERRWAQTDARIQGHTAAEVKRHTAQTYEGTIDRLAADAINESTPEALDQAARMRFATRQRQGQLVGTDAQTLELQHRADEAKLYGGAIEAAIEGGEWSNGKALLARYGERLPKEVRVGLESRLRDGGQNQQAQDTSDTIFRSGYATTKAAADRMVGQIADADLRQRTQVKVDQEWARREAALADARGATFESIAKAVEGGGDVEELLAQAPDAAALKEEDRRALRDVAKRTAARQEPAEGSDAYYLLRNAAAVAPQAFLATDLRTYRGRIPKGELAAMVELQADMRGQATRTSGKDAKPARGILSAEEIANNALRGIDINPNAADGKIDPRALAFKNQFDRALVAAGGADHLDSEGIKSIANRLMAEEVRKVSRSGWNPMRLFLGDTYDETSRAFESPGADRRAFAVGQIPGDTLPQVVQALRSAGIQSPTEEQILRAYNTTISTQAAE
jgi:hypothetical protein